MNSRIALLACALTALFSVIHVRPALAALTAKERDARSLLARQARSKELDQLKRIRKHLLLSGLPQATEIADTLRDRKEALFNQKTRSLRPDVRDSRLVVAPLMKDEDVRHLTTDWIQERLRTKSRELEKIMLNSAMPLNFDVVVVGAGPEAAAYVQELTSVNPALKALIIDERSQVGGVFSIADAFFRLNSTTRANTGARAAPGDGDLNFVHSILGLPDMSANKWTEAGMLEDVSATGVLLSSAEPLLGTEVTGLSLQKYYVEIPVRFLESRASARIRAQKVVFATGLGKSGVNLTTDLRVLRLKRDGSPIVEAFEPFVESRATSRNKTPFRDLVGKTIGVIGLGDSARVLNEFLLRLAPENAYGADKAQIGEVEKIYWFLGYATGDKEDPTFATCKEYLDKSRARYAWLSAGINSGKIIPVIGRVTGAEIVGQENSAGQEQISLNFQTAKSGAAARNSARDGIPYIQEDDARRGKTQGPATDRVAFDKVIDCTGFRDARLGAILGQALGRSSSTLRDLVENGMLTKKTIVSQEFGGKEVAIANQLTSDRRIELIGPANESIGGLPDKTELSKVNANTVSLFANVYRTIEAARQLEEAKPWAAAQQTAVATGAVSIPKAGKNTQVLAMVPAEASLELLDRMRLSYLGEVALKTGLEEAMFGARITGPAQIEAILTPDGIGLRAIGLGMSSAEFSSRIENSHLLVAALAKKLQDPATKVRSVLIQVPMRSTGGLEFRNTQIIEQKGQPVGTYIDPKRGKAKLRAPRDPNREVRLFDRAALDADLIPGGNLARVEIARPRDDYELAQRTLGVGTRVDAVLLTEALQLYFAREGKPALAKLKNLTGADQLVLCLGAAESPADEPLLYLSALALKDGRPISVDASVYREFLGALSLSSLPESAIEFFPSRTWGREGSLIASEDSSAIVSLTLNPRSGESSVGETLTGLDTRPFRQGIDRAL